VSLQMIDTLWVEHLESMDYMRSSVNLRAYGQRDPLVEYKKEGTILFREMNLRVASEIFATIPHVQVDIKLEQTPEVKEIHESGDVLNKVEKNDEEQKEPTAPSEYKNVGRNDMCPCGSGKKFKKCHGA